MTADDDDVPAELTDDPEVEKLANEIRKDQETMSCGIKPDELTAYIQGGGMKWNFKEGNPRRQRMTCAKAMDDLKIKLDELSKTDRPDVAVAKIKAEEKANKIMLEAALEGFDYNDLVDKLDVEPSELMHLSTEVFSFLVVAGGKAGYRRLQMLQRLDTLNRLLISKEQKTDGDVSSIGKTD